MALDQLTKALVRSSLAPGESVPLIEGLLHLTHVRNMGAAFGLLPGARPLFIATSAFVLFVVAAYWRRSHPRQWPVVIALALVCSGAFGNLIDRSVAGRVTDFLDFAFIDFPVWNVADAAIVAGVGVLTGWLLFVPEPEPEPERDGLAVAVEPDATRADGEKNEVPS